jgi:diguanylate cyclase (GGDEF)-like protein
MNAARFAGAALFLRCAGGGESRRAQREGAVKTKERKNPAYFLIWDVLFGVVVLAGLIAILCFSARCLFSAPFSAASDADWSTGWTTEDGADASLTDLNDLPRTDAGAVALYKDLPVFLEQGLSLNFRSKNVNFTLSVDGRTLCDYEPEVGIAAGRSDGSSYHSVLLSDTLAGETVCLTAYPVYQDNSCFFGEMTLEPSGDYYQTFLHNHLPSFLLCLAIMLIGVWTAVSAFFAQPALRSSIAAMAMLEIMLGAWSCLETMFLQMTLGSHTVLHALSYLLLMGMPYPAVRLADSMRAVPKRRYVRIAGVAVLAEFLVLPVLNYNGVLDFHEALPIIHGMLLAAMLLCFHILASNYLYCRRKNIRAFKPVTILAFLVLIVFSGTDVLRYWQSGRNSADAGVAMRIGLLAFTILLSGDAFVQLMHRGKLLRQAEYMKRIAFTDVLTGLPNRAAYVRAAEELNGKIRSGTLRQVLICQMDINELKQANDSFGHAYGDKHIVAAARIIEGAFGGVGSCYRTGGDEFVVFLTGESAEGDYKKGCAAMLKAENEYNHTEGVAMPLVIAFGAAIHSAGGRFSSVEDANREADREMYRKKKEQKCG